MQIWNILPLNDLKPHIESEVCECCPIVENCEGGLIITHNSFDGREAWETEKARIVQ